MRKSRLSKAKQKKLVEFFVACSTARTAAAMTGVNKTTASYVSPRILYQVMARDLVKNKGFRSHVIQ